MSGKIDKIIRKLCSFICHQKPERCFKCGEYVFPVCARCTGIIISFITALVLMANGVYIGFVLAVLFTLLMFLDWIIQTMKIKESTNIRRFVTGLIGGFGMSYFYFYIIKFLLWHLF